MVFVIHWHESAMGIHMTPGLNPHPPLSPSILLGCPSAPAVSVLFHASNLNWSSISHMVIYMFQCNSLISSHPHLFPQCPKVFSLYVLCALYVLFCYLTYRVAITIFLNSRYMHFNHKWMLNFVKGFLCIYWDNHMAFIFQFVHVVNYIEDILASLG